ncbi:MAG: hypothetical protein U1A24_01065 [Cypionkella sp.]|uniref:hypothetical protein n=1 Tax=Cypionkella sp. TaxID=2811411 RepID=UPI002AB91CF2|nr:hypothetical protein [Cypionkella sp.]MDZ4309139.1 hypothetical protein [Cypionkella sp.]
MQNRSHVHILIGPRQPIRPGILHAHPGYLRGFWYFDPAGVNMTSSLLRRAFRPDQIDAKAARYFFNDVTGWNLRQNASKFPQTARKALPPAFATVFLQEALLRNPVMDSSCETSVIAGGHEQTEHTDLQDAELARV